MAEETELNPLLQPPVLAVVFQYLKIGDLDVSQQVCWTWNQLSEPFRLPWTRIVICGHSELQQYLSLIEKSTAAGESVQLGRRFILSCLDLGSPLITKFLEMHHMDLHELKIMRSCIRLEHLFGSLYFPNITGLNIGPPITQTQLQALTYIGLGAHIETLKRFKLELGPFTSSTNDCLQVLCRLRLFHDLEELHVKSSLASAYEVYLILCPRLSIRKLFLFGSAMKLPVNQGHYFDRLSHLEMDGLHQLQFRSERPRLYIKTLILRSEEYETTGCEDLKTLFPDLKVLRVILLGKRAKTFLPMAFLLEKLETLEVMGNFTDKMICGVETPIQVESCRKMAKSIWKAVKSMAVSSKPYVFNLKELKNLTLTSPLMSSTTIIHGIKFCSKLSQLKLRMNPESNLNMKARRVLWAMISPDKFALEYRDCLKCALYNVECCLRKMKLTDPYYHLAESELDVPNPAQYKWSLPLDE